MTQVPESGNPEGVRHPARVLGIAGCVPFAVLSLWLFGIADDHPWRSETIALLTGYSAVLLSFLGGIRWGLALAERNAEGARLELTLGILPTLVGWAALAITVPYAFAVLAVAFAAQGASDALAIHGGAAPAWFGRLRSQLTLVAVAAMILAFVATG